MAAGVAVLFSAAGVAALAPLPHGDAARLADICMPLLPGRPTASSECTVEQLQFGNTNRLFLLARARGDRYLVREVKASDRPPHIPHILALVQSFSGSFASVWHERGACTRSGI